MKKLAERFSLNAMCFLDQHFVQKQTLTTARIGASHLIKTTEGYKMIVSPAQSVDIPPLPYNEHHAMVQVKTPIREYLEAVLDSGVTHHFIVGISNMSKELLAVAEMLNLKTFYIE